jgi:hypothetical protein
MHDSNHTKKKYSHTPQPRAGAPSPYSHLPTQTQTHSSTYADTSLNGRIKDGGGRSQVREIEDRGEKESQTNHIHVTWLILNTPLLWTRSRSTLLLRRMQLIPLPRLHDPWRDSSRLRVYNVVAEYLHGLWHASRPLDACDPAVIRFTPSLHLSYSFFLGLASLLPPCSVCIY